MAKAPRQPDDKKTPPAAEAIAPSLPVIEFGSEGDIDLGELPLSDDASAIPLAALPEMPSGQSLTSWTDVIRRQRAAQASSSPDTGNRVDSPSDRDLLGRELGTAEDNSVVTVGKKGPRTGDTSEIPPAELPVYTAPLAMASESDIDLGPMMGDGGSEVAFDVMYPPSDAAGRMPMPALPADEDSIPFGISAEPGVSGVDLGAAADSELTPGKSSILDVLLRESTAGQAADKESAAGDLLDFGDEPPIHRSPRPTMGHTGEQPPVRTQPGIDLGANADEPGIDLDGPDSADGSADVVDLYADGHHPATLTDSGSLEISEEAIEESERRAQALDSSSVDMNARPSLSGSEFDLPSPASESDIDLDLPPVTDEAGSSMVHPKDRLESNREAIAAEFRARKERREQDGDSAVIPSEREERRPTATGGLVRGSVLGLLLGAGGVLAAYFAGALPNRQPESPQAATQPPVAPRGDDSVAKKEAEAAKADLAALKTSLVAAGIDPEKPGDAVKTAIAAKDVKITELLESASMQAEAMESAKATAKRATDDLTTVKKSLTEAVTATTEAKKSQAAAEKAAETAKSEALDARKSADDLAAAFKAASLDPTKPEASLKALLVAKTEAEAKAKEADGRVAEAEKKVKTAEATAVAMQKDADALKEARAKSDTTLAAVAEKLGKAKFVADKPDAATLLKGLDDALKASTTDATATLRDELAKARATEAKSKADLAAATLKTIDAEKAAIQANAEAKKSVEALTTQMANKVNEMDKAFLQLKTMTDKKVADGEAAMKELATTKEAAKAAEAMAAQEKANAVVAAAKVDALAKDNERLTRDIAAVRELADLIKTSPTSSGTTTKVDPAKLAERFYGDGVRSFFAGRYADAETNLRKAIQFRGDDARYHYLLGLALWSKKDMKAAEAAFECGRDLENEGRPGTRQVSLALEKVQGLARQAVNAYRP